MSAGRVAIRYARALYRLCKEGVTVAKKYESFFVSLNELFSHEEAGKILRSPVMPLDLKIKLLEYGLKQAEADPTFADFVKSVVDAGRVRLLPEIGESFKKLIRQQEGIVTANLSTANALSEAEQTEIGQALGKMLDKKVELRATTDPNLLGGFLIRVGHYRVDMSVRTKLENLAAAALEG